MRRLLIVSLLLLAQPAFAEGPMATTNPAQEPAPQSSTGAPPLATDADTAVQDRQRVVIGPCGPTKAKPDGSPDQAAHGVVEAGIGTHGYRHLGASVCKPIGTNGAVAVSISQTDGDWGGRRR